MLWDNPEGWGGEGGVRGFRWGTRAPMDDSCQCISKTTTILYTESVGGGDGDRVMLIEVALTHHDYFSYGISE